MEEEPSHSRRFITRGLAVGLLVVVVWLGAYVAGCSSGTASVVPPTASLQSPVAQINQLIASASLNDSRPLLDDYVLGPEDMIQVTVYNVAGSEGGGLTPRDLTLRVSQQGMINLPLIGEVRANGLTVPSLEKLLRERYDKFIYNPEIGVAVREFRSQRVSLIGAVNRAGVVELTGPKTLIDVLASAGGVNQRAGNQVHVYRRTAEGRKSFVIDLFALTSSLGLINEQTAGVDVLNIMVQAGDIINVPEAGTFYVDGAVNHAGTFPLGRRYTVNQAITLAGGLNIDLADFGGITLYRTVGNEVKQIPINLNAIRKGEEPDLPLQSDDFLFVPISGLKWAWNFFIRTVGMPSPYPYIMPK